MIENSYQQQVMLVVPQTEWDELNSKLQRIEILLTNSEKQTDEAEWVDSKTASKILGISTKTLQNYRERRDIPFSQFYGNIRYKKSDLNHFLESQYIESNYS